jgi:hypothetical protein
MQEKDFTYLNVNDSHSINDSVLFKQKLLMGRTFIFLNYALDLFVFSVRILYDAISHTFHFFIAVTVRSIRILSGFEHKPFKFPQLGSLPNINMENVVTIMSGCQFKHSEGKKYCFVDPIQS